MPAAPEDMKDRAAHKLPPPLRFRAAQPAFAESVAGRPPLGFQRPLPETATNWQSGWRACRFVVQIGAVFEPGGHGAVLFAAGQRQIEIGGSVLMRNRRPLDIGEFQACSPYIHPVEHYSEERSLAQAALRTQIRHQFLK